MGEAGTHEGNDLVDSVNELWREAVADRFHHQVPGLLGHRPFTHFANMARAKVACHDDNSVSEVDQSTLTIRQSTIVQDLQEKSKEFFASFLDLVNQQDGVGLATNVFRQLACNIDGSESHSRQRGLS